jgi:hypothetical protein
LNNTAENILNNNDDRRTLNNNTDDVFPLPPVEEDPSFIALSTGASDVFDTSSPADFTGLDLFVLIAGVAFVVVLVVCIYLLIRYQRS